MIKRRIEEGKIRFLVTGATGFVGRALVAQLVALGHAEVLALTRQAPANPVAGAKYRTGGDLSSQTQCQPVLAGVHAIVHAAARAHVMDDTTADPLTEFRRVNVQGTLHLARQAAAAGVPARVLPVPVWALQAGASLLGKGDAVQRLCGNLQVDMSKARSLLGWLPPVSVEEGLRRAMAV